MQSFSFHWSSVCFAARDSRYIHWEGDFLEKNDLLVKSKQGSHSVVTIDKSNRASWQIITKIYCICVVEILWKAELAAASIEIIQSVSFRSHYLNTSISYTISDKKRSILSISRGILRFLEQFWLIYGSLAIAIEHFSCDIRKSISTLLIITHISGIDKRRNSSTKREPPTPCLEQTGTRKTESRCGASTAFRLTLSTQGLLPIDSLQRRDVYEELLMQAGGMQEKQGVVRGKFKDLERIWVHLWVEACASRVGRYQDTEKISSQLGFLISLMRTSKSSRGATWFGSFLN